MNKEDNKKVIGYLDATYNILKNDNLNGNKLTNKQISYSWGKALDGYSYSDVIRAIESYISKYTAKPKPASILAELQNNQAIRHVVFNRLAYDDVDSDTILTKEILFNLMEKEHRPFKKMNIFSLQKNVIDKLNDPLQANAFRNIIDKIWGFIISTELTVLHLELCMNNCRGVKLSFDHFMHELIKTDDIINDFYKNIDVEKSTAKDYLKKLMSKIKQIQACNSKNLA